ncbi:unnamed protein product, partial [Prorocentrum cordatum]
RQERRRLDRLAGGEGAGGVADVAAWARFACVEVDRTVKANSEDPEAREAARASAAAGGAAGGEGGRAGSAAGRRALRAGAGRGAPAAGQRRVPPGPAARQCERRPGPSARLGALRRRYRHPLRLPASGPERSARGGSGVEA